MAWKERSRMDRRILLVGEYIKGDKPMAELCRDFGISRKTGYKWVGRSTRMARHWTSSGITILTAQSSSYRLPAALPSRLPPSSTA